METPSVVAVCLVNGREVMVQRAIKSFLAQTYKQKELLIYNTGPGSPHDYIGYAKHIFVASDSSGQTVGTLRNKANACTSADIIVHMDSDDWSHPRRIEEQVELLTSRKLCCVGYRDALFYDETEGHFAGAWLYENKDPQYMIGASLCYRRSFWEVNPFPDAPKRKGATGEDTIFIKAANRIGVSSIPSDRLPYAGGECRNGDEPRMICSIHGDNTQHYDPAEYVEKQMGTSWARAEAWDKHCADTMRY